MEAESAAQPIQFGLGFCIGILKNMGINLTAKELKLPTNENLYVIYKAFLSECLSISHDTYEKDHLVDAILNFNEDVIKNQSESFKIMQFYIIVKFFFELCGLNPSYMEIFHPLKGRFPRLLSGMISFCRFEFQELGDDFSHRVQENKNYIRKCNEEKKEIEELSGKIYYINSENMKNRPLIEQCKKRSAGLKEKNENLLEETKRLQQEEEADDREENALEAEEKELLERQQTIKKKFILYDKLIIKSPQRLNKELDKNEARIIELKKCEIKVKAEIDEEKRNLFERENFIESSKSIHEIFENHFLNHVHSANSKKKEIESVKETITNLNFEYLQVNSSIESYAKNYDKLVQNVDNHSKAIEKKLMEFKENDDMNNQQIAEYQTIIKNVLEEQNSIVKKIQETKSESNELMNNAFEKIQMFQKNEEFCKTITAAKLKTMTAIDEAGCSKLENALNRMKKSAEMFRKWDNEARGV